MPPSHAHLFVSESAPTRTRAPRESVRGVVTADGVTSDGPTADRLDAAFHRADGRSGGDPQ